jgi:hypothetical protein
MKQFRGLSFYHRTSAENARFILERGFHDSTGYLLGNRAWRGVWLSETSSGCRATDGSEVLLRITLDLSEHELARWEWTGENCSYREWLIPSALLNPHMSAEVVRAASAAGGR